MEFLQPRAYTKDIPAVFQESDKLLNIIVKIRRAIRQARLTQLSLQCAS
jgi:hypothetical protein